MNLLGCAVQFTMDSTVFAYLAALCAGTAIACGLVPAWHASRTNLVATLNDAGRGSAGSRSRGRWTGAFVIAQVAAALVLLTGAALMIQNLMNAVRIDAGVETGGLMQMTLDLRRSDDTRERRLLFLSRLEERLAANPSANLALASQVPLGGALVRRIRIEEQPVSPEATLPPVSLVSVGERYFDVVGARVIAGRAFTADDFQQPGDGLVVNERFARMYSPNEPVVGKRVVLTEPNAPPDGSDPPKWTTIVGVVGNVRQRVLPSGEFDPVVYQPYEQDPPQTMRVIARSSSAPATSVAFVREQVSALDPTGRFSRLARLRQLGIGLILGTAGAAAIATVLPAILVGTGGASYLAFVGVVVVLMAAGVTASTLPARRATRLDPTTALQAE